jgi:hypothetical protein
MQTVCNDVEKCRHTAEKCWQTWDMRKWKCFNIEKLCLVNYPYLCMIFTIFFSRAKVRTVHSTYKVCACTFRNNCILSYTRIIKCQDTIGISILFNIGAPNRWWCHRYIFLPKKLHGWYPAISCIETAESSSVQPNGCMSIATNNHLAFS